MPYNGGTLRTKLAFLRHGESIWNKENHFTGWMEYLILSGSLPRGVTPNLYGQLIQFINADFMLKQLLDVGSYENLKQQEICFGSHPAKNKGCLYHWTGK